MPESRYLIKNGFVLDNKRAEFIKQDILIINETIAEVGLNLKDETAQIIDATNNLIMPGLVNTHIHLWQAGLRGIAGNWTLMDYFNYMLDSLGHQYTPEDMYMANLMGALEQIDAGVTCVLDWCNNLNTQEHAYWSLKGLEEAGIRGVFGYGPPGVDAAKWWFNSSELHPPKAKEFFENYFSSKDGLLRMALALRGPDSTQDDVLFKDIKLARDLDVLATMHVGIRSKWGVKKIYDAGLLSEHINFVHANNLADEEYKLIVDHGASISVTPEVEMQMGMGFPATGKIIRAGGSPVIGTDIASNIDGNLFTQLRFAIQTQRAIDNELILNNDKMVEKIELSYKHSLDWVTNLGAKALGLGNEVGLLIKGMKADLIIIDTSAINLWPVHNPYESILFYIGRHNIDTVMINGKLVKQNGKLLYANLPNLKEQMMESSARILNDAKILNMKQHYLFKDK